MKGGLKVVESLEMFLDEALGSRRVNARKEMATLENEQSR